MGYMKWNWSIYIKSHCCLPDYENECEAASKIDAAQIFAKLPALQEHNWQDLMPFIELEKT